MIIRAILPQWAKAENPKQRGVYEGQFSQARIEQLNEQFYNIYFLPNYPAIYNDKKTVEGADVDTFKYVFVDLDMKDYQSEDKSRRHEYADKDAFILTLLQSEIPPSIINDSGNGVHAYWEIQDLDAMSYLKLQRRLARFFKTDPEVSKIYQLMRLPGTVNTKDPEHLKEAARVYQEDLVYSAEQLDRALPPITPEDEEYCNAHFDKTYLVENEKIEVNDRLPSKFGALLESNQEVKDIWVGNTDDRSKGDYRLGHIMFASGFTKDEAASVLVNTAKALERAPKHRVNYAMSIIEKIWTFEQAPKEAELTLSASVKEILQRPTDGKLGARFPCYKYLDNTQRGFRLRQVIGLVAGSGVGKTAVALNMFMGFVEHNPDYVHFFVPLEQPAIEIAERWRAMCGDRVNLHDKVEVIDNYDEASGTFRHLSLAEVQAYIVKYQEKTGRKVGCVVIDHIAVLKRKDKDGNRLELEDLCREMKAFAASTNTMLIMQSQTSREKAGIGDLELDKDAAYGTTFFEAFCDYLITVWQPLKRAYTNPACPTVTAFKFCKIRHKNQKLDQIVEDVRYTLVFDPNTERLRQMTQDEEKSFDYFNKQATNLRGKDRKTDVLTYKSVKFDEKSVDQIKIAE